MVFAIVRRKRKEKKEKPDEPEKEREKPKSNTPKRVKPVQLTEIERLGLGADDGLEPWMLGRSAPPIGHSYP